MRTDRSIKIYKGHLEMHRRDCNYGGAICISRSTLLPLEHIASSFLSLRELEYLNGLVSGKRRLSYLIGRFAAKNAISFLTKETAANVNIQYGVFNNPIINSNDGQGRLEISISHSSDMGAALVFPAAHPMGIDMERIDSVEAAVVEKELTPSEVGLLKEIAPWCGYATMLAVAWTIKESLSKTLKTGLMTPFHIFEISRIEKNEDTYVSHFRNFAQYKANSFMIKNYAFSVSYPKKTNLIFDLPEMSNVLS